MIALLLVVGVCYLAHLLLTTAAGPNESAGVAGPPAVRSNGVSGYASWTALDDHQLHRLLDESPP